ncbi:MAG: ATP-binding protein [Capsulimonadaceae bacterium]|nr:ATP-binding protein [Capsulimonadaceae bacterium]
MTDKMEKLSDALLDLAVVTLTFPCSAEYVSIARLAILGIASRMAFSYDEVEDIRLAVGEACTHAVERSVVADMRAPTNDGHGTITIVSTMTINELTVEIKDDVPTGFPPEGVFQDPVGIDIDRQGLGALLMEILVDKVDVDTTPNGTCVRLVKHAHGV